MFESLKRSFDKHIVDERDDVALANGAQVGDTVYVASGYTSDELFISDVLADVGLTPTPTPESPFSVEMRGGTLTVGDGVARFR